MFEPNNIIFPSRWVKSGVPGTRPLPEAIKYNHKDILPQKKSPLFRLSPEIRGNIFTLVLQTDSDVRRMYGDKNYLKRPGENGPWRVCTALLQTCKAIYIETWAIPTLNTTLIIHEGNERDRPHRPVPSFVHPLPRMFNMEPWQLLLIQNVQINFSQYKLESGSMHEWMSYIQEGRVIAADIVKRYIHTHHRNDEFAFAFVKNSLSGVKLRSLTIRINRRDWWNWETEPVAYPTPEDVEERFGLLRLQQPNSPYFGLTNRNEHEALFDPKDFTLTLALEAYALKIEEFEHEVALAKNWNFEIPPHAHAYSYPRELRWDGKVRKESWVRKTWEDVDWFRKTYWRNVSKGIEVRYLRFVQHTTASGDRDIDDEAST